MRPNYAPESLPQNGPGLQRGTTNNRINVFIRVGRRGQWTPLPLAAVSDTPASGMASQDAPNYAQVASSPAHHIDNLSLDPSVAVQP